MGVAGAHTFESYLRSSTQVLPDDIRKKSPHASSKGREEQEPFKGMPEHSVLFNKVYPPGELFYQSLTCWGFDQSPNLPGGREIPKSALPLHLVPSKELRGDLRYPGEVHSPRAQPHRKTET